MKVPAGSLFDEAYACAYASGVATRVVPKTHLRDRIRAELESIGEDTVLITERGRPLAVLVGVDRWNELQQAIEELEETVAVLEHRTTRAQSAPAEQVFSAIEADVPHPDRQAG